MTESLVESDRPGAEPARVSAAATRDTVRTRDPAREPVWPRVFGVFSVVLGAMGMLKGVADVLGVLFFKGFFGWLTTSSGRAAAMSQMAGWSIALAISSLFLGALGLMAGVLLLTRRPGAVPALQAWSVLKFFQTCLVAWITYVVQTRTAAVIQHQGAAEVIAAGVMQGAAAVGAVFILAWGWAYPVVALVWFWRPTIRAQVRAWRLPPPPAP